MESGKVIKEHYAYTKNGSCSLLAAIEPLTGKRFGAVYQQRTKKEYALLMRDLAERYPTAEKIRLVQDNLNTHNASSFYEHLPADEALKLAERFEFSYTPKSASWLNMIEIEFSALSRQCLKRRIPDQEILEREILSLMREREKKGILITWQFTVHDARTKLNRHYQSVHEMNKKF